MKTEYRQTFKFNPKDYDEIAKMFNMPIGLVDSHGDVIMPGAFKKPEIKQDKFNRIFDVTDAEVVV